MRLERIVTASSPICPLTLHLGLPCRWQSSDPKGEVFRYNWLVPAIGMPETTALKLNIMPWWLCILNKIGCKRRWTVNAKPEPPFNIRLHMVQLVHYTTGRIFYKKDASSARYAYKVLRDCLSRTGPQSNKGMLKRLLHLWDVRVLVEAIFII